MRAVSVVFRMGSAVTLVALQPGALRYAMGWDLFWMSVIIMLTLRPRSSQPPAPGGATANGGLERPSTHLRPRASIDRVRMAGAGRGEPDTAPDTASRQEAADAAMVRATLGARGQRSASISVKHRHSAVAVGSEVGST